MSMKSFVIMASAIFFSTATRSQVNTSEFCSSRTTEAYHSPKCDWYVVQDPRRVEEVRISHKPAYHTYSRWELDGHSYVLAYRDIEHQPQEMAVDVYAETGSEHKLIGMLRIAGVVKGVSAENLTGSAFPEIVFRVDSGELKYIDVLHLSEGKAREIFWYGASEIEILSIPTPRVVAKSRLANVVEEFTWDSRLAEFKRLREYPWHKPS